MKHLHSAAVAAALALAGCAGLPRERGYAETSALIDARLGVAPDVMQWSTPEPAPVPTGPLGRDEAVALAFVHNPDIREHYARVGLARAELEGARRIGNPGFGFSRLHGEDSHPKITRSVSLDFADLLLLPARKRFAQAELERIQHAVAAQLLSLAADVEIAWYTAVSAQQVARMREIVAGAAEASARLAARFHAAGNIGLLQLERERAQASEARIESVRAQVAALEARARLAQLTGLSAEAPWGVPTRMPAPSERSFDAAALVARAFEQRLDLAAARQAVALREDALGVTRRWRWLGTVEVGFEHEREGGVAQGPSLSIGLPIFDQGQAARSRADAELVQARAALDALALSVANDTVLAVQRVQLSREIAAQYRSVLVPARESIVARSQEHVNYMLLGVFELILARREEFDAYQAYLEAVRDYWSARAELRRVLGGSLPDDEEPKQATLGIDALLPSTKASGADEDAGAPQNPHEAHDRTRHHEHGHHEHGDTP